MSAGNETYDAFISYSRADGRHAGEIDSFLCKQGLKSFFDRRNLDAGLPWVRALEKVIGSAKTAIVLIGPGGLGNTQQYERELAIIRQTEDAAFRVIPVILPKTANDLPFDFLRNLSRVDFSGVEKISDAPVELQRLLSAIRGESSARKEARQVICPWRGLDAFREEDSAFFFGRGSESEPESPIGQLVRKVREHRFVMVVGRSGSGKSSLVFAGLVPAIRRERDRFWTVLSFRPGGEPLRAIAEAFNPKTPDEGTAGYARKIREETEALRSGGPELLASMIEHYLQRAEGRPDQLLLFIDQWEELYASVTIEPERLKRRREDEQRFIELLLNATQSPCVRVIGTVRADFYDTLIRDLGSVLPAQQVTLGAMPPEELKRAIVEPARIMGLSFNPPALVEQILGDVGSDEGRLPLLQHALMESWKRRSGNTITADSYARSGGVQEAIRNTAEQTFEKLSGEDQRAARKLFLRLVTPGEGQEDTRVRAAMPSDPAQRRIMEQFAGSRTRLLVTGSDRAAGPTVEVAHEALIRTWPRLRGWIDANREKLRARAAVLQAKAEWEQQGRREDLLLPSGFQLERARALLAEPGDLAIDDIHEFIALSSAREQRRRLTSRAWVAAFILFLIVGLIASAVAAKQARDKRDQLLALQSRFLINLANQRLKERDAGTAMLLALQALPDMNGGIERPLVHEAVATLFNAYQELQERIVLKGHKSSLWSANFSPDGRRIVTASEDNTARVWDAQTGEVVHILEGHTGSVRAAAFSPDGPRVVTASTDHTARVWNLETGKQSTILEHGAAVRSAAFSPDGRRVVTASDDKTARVWDARTGEKIAVLMGHTEPVRVAAFSPNGRYILTASDDTSARLWDAETGDVIHILEGHTKSVRGAAFSPDGAHAVTTSLDHTARLWSMETGRQSAILEHGEVVWGAVFSPDGRRVVTASDDNTARVWDAQKGTQIFVLKGHDGPVQSAVFSSDGRSIVTASDDNTAHIWNADSGTLATILRGHLSGVRSAAFSPDGQYVLTASRDTDTTARLWSVETEKSTQMTVLAAHIGSVRSALFNPDGRRVLTVSDANTVLLWDAKVGQQIAVFTTHSAMLGAAAFSPDGRLVAVPDGNSVVVRDANTGTKEYPVLQGHSAAVWSAAFGPDGRRIVTASDDQTARVWDVQTGTQIAVLRAHTAPVRSAVFSPDGLRVISTQMAQRISGSFTSDDSTALLWNALSGEVIRRFEGHMGQVYDATFSPNGKQIVTVGADKTVRIWDTATGAMRSVLTGHSDSVLSAAFSPHGHRIVTASADNTTRVWDAESGETVAVLQGHSGPVWGAVFSPDGERILTASDDSTARIWRVFPTEQTLVDRSKVVVPRCLTPEQRKNAFLDREPPAWCIERRKWPY